MKNDQSGPKILRKLGGSENLYDENVSKCDKINSRAFRIQTNIDIYTRIDLVHEAISAWKDAHHFLRCNIVHDVEGYKCFAYAPDHILNSNENLNFLYFESNETHEKEEDIMQLFLEKELSTPMDSSKLLWRLFLIQVDSGGTGDFAYYLIFTANHAIIDGRNVSQILSQLFSFLERLHLNRLIEFELYECLPARENHVKTEACKTDPSLNDPIIQNNFKQTLVIPESMVNQNYEPFTIYDPEKEGAFFTVDKQLYSTYKALVEENKNHFTAVRSLVYDKDVLQKLLQICKCNNTKLTGCLQMISVLAIQQLFKHFTHDNLESVCYSTAVSLRPFLHPPGDVK